MTTAADDSAVEGAFEAILAGRPVPEGAAGLAAFTQAVRASATQAGRPDAVLSELLATGLLTDQSSPSVRTARSAGSAPVRRPSRVRIRRRFAMIFPILLAKLLSAGAVAQAATGAGLVLVVATGAGATGVLGDDVRNTVADVVGITVEEPGQDDVVDDGTTDTDTDTDTDTGAEPTPVGEPTTPAEPTEAEFDAAAWQADGPAEDQTFGEWVSEGARDGELKDALRAEGLSFGAVVSQWAHRKHVDLDELGLEGVAGENLVEAPPTTTPDVDQDTTVERKSATTQRVTGGKPAGALEGNGRGNGNGHADASTNGNGNGNGNGSKGNGRN